MEWNWLLRIFRRREYSNEVSGRSSSYLPNDSKKPKSFHLSISLYNKVFENLSPNLSDVQTGIVIAFCEPSHTKFIYNIPHPYLINPLSTPIIISTLEIKCPDS